MRALAVLVMVLLQSLPSGLRAQAVPPATLIADSVTVTDAGRLTAQGNVEVLFDGTRLSAAAITYDRATDRLEIVGPILIVAPDGTILTAARADLDPRLENGLLAGARLVLDRRLQLAAARIDRVEGRYSALTGVAATACRICAGGPPLWEIRAARVVHDTVERQLYFDNAQLRIAGVPVAWLPRLRLPDPTLARATGVLVPQLRSTDQLGLGIKLPYFLALGDSRDLTLTPYLSARTRTLEFRYREAFLAGTLEVTGALTRDDLREGQTRRYLAAQGAFDLGAGFRLTLDAVGVSDPSWLRDYGVSDDDRLTSVLALTRVRADDLLRADVSVFRTLRADEVQAELPGTVLRLDYERHLPAAAFGGDLNLGLRAEAFERQSTIPGDAGRDVARFGLRGDWRADRLLPGGFWAEARAGIELGYYAITDDPDFAAPLLRATPSAAVALRWPLMRTTPAGVVHVIEPAVTLAWSRTSGSAVPNEDSRLVEFDSGNLLGQTRYPGEDAREDGARAGLAVQWMRIDPAGWDAGLTLGRIVRDRPDRGFTLASGLSGESSDWLLAGHLALPGGFRLDGRTLFDSDFDFDKTEARLAWANERLDLTAAYAWLPAEPVEGRGTAISEWAVGADWRIDPRWSLALDGRYDLVARQPVRAGIGIGWRSECVTVDLSISRRYTTSAEVDPITDFGLRVNLTGFAADGRGTGPAAACRG